MDYEKRGRCQDERDQLRTEFRECIAGDHHHIQVKADIDSAAEARWVFSQLRCITRPGAFLFNLMILGESMCGLFGRESSGCRLIGIICFFWAISLPIYAAELMAGVARIDITPPATGTPMGGYGARRGPSTGVHDPLLATVLVLRLNGEGVAIINCDLLSFPSERIINEARAKKLVNHVLIAGTHTHSGPITWENQNWPADAQSWFASTEDKIIAAIAEASAKMFPARIASGFGEIYLGHNRRRVDADGKTTMFWRNAERQPTGPLDPTVGVIRVDDNSGRVRAILVNYACHAVILGPDNREISADYPGYLRRELEREYPGSFSLFIQGGAGDINPYLDKQPVKEGGFSEAEKMGKALAAKAIDVARRLKPTAKIGASLYAVGEVIEFHDRWEREKRLRVGITALLINNEIAIATLPGEPFVELQIAFRDKAEFPRTFLFGYTYSAGGEWAGYLPTIRAAAEGGYGAGYSTQIEVGAGEAMIDRLLAHLYKMAGKLREVPR